MSDVFKTTALAACFLLCACDGPESGPVDAEDASFLGAGKADGGVSEGSAEALAILALVNTASFELLDDGQGVGLDVRAASGIFEYRVGTDGVEGTDDDTVLESLAELDAIPYVGPVAFSRLRTYALDHGYAGEPEPEGPGVEALELGVLTLANNASEVVLDDDVGLDARAAANIEAHRRGADEVRGTSDDRYFVSVEELDAIAYVGSRALEKMQAYALDNGYVDPDPYSELFCARAPMTRDDALGYLTAGERFNVTLSPDSFGVRTWERSCGPTGCGEWRNSSQPVEGRIHASSLGAHWYPRVDMSAAEIAGDANLTLHSDEVSFWASGTRRHNVYYPSTGRFAWDTTVTLRAAVDYRSIDGAATFGSGDIDGDTEFRVSDGCFQLRNLDTRGGTGALEVLTIAYGTF